MTGFLVAIALLGAPDVQVDAPTTGNWAIAQGALATPQKHEPTQNVKHVQKHIQKDVVQKPTQAPIQKCTGRKCRKRVRVRIRCRRCR